ncbi:MAG: BatD family protein [Candidatus Bathyarchaeota archaeon]
MRKTAAFLTCLFTVLWLGLLVLHPSLKQLALWLSPSLGAELYTTVTVFYLLAADPFAYAAVGLLWLAVAFLGGLIVRRRLGAVLTMLMVWLMLVPVLALSLFGLAMNVQSLVEDRQGGSPLSAIPPIPPGMTITGLLETPIVGEKVAQMMGGGIENLSQEQAMDMLRETAYSLGFSALLRPLLIVVGALLGVEAGRILETRGAELLPRNLSRVSQGIFIVLVLLVSSGVTPSRAQIIDTSDGIYVENLLGIADRQGRAMVLDAFVATAGTRVGHSNLVAHMLVVQRMNLDPLVATMSLPEGLDAGSLVNLIPGTLLVSVYVDTSPSEARSLAAEMSHATAEAYGIEVHSLGAFPVPEMEYSSMALPSLTVVVEYSDSGLEELAPVLMAEFTGRGGLAQAISGALTSGALVPGATEGSPETTVLAVGSVNLGPLLERMSIPAYPAELEEPLNLVKSESLHVALGAHIWDTGVKPRGGGFSLDLLELLGQPSVSLSQSSDLSFITLVTPNNTRAGDLTPNVAVCTDQPEDSYVLSLYIQFLTGLGIIEVTHDPNLGAEDMRVSTSLPLPPRVVLERTLEGPSAVGQTLSVTVTATNRGTQAVENLRITDGGLLSTYSQSVKVEGGTEKIEAALGPGQSTSISYTVKPGNPGAYTLRPATAAYSFGGQSYSSLSERSYLSTGPPNILTAAKTLRRDTVMTLDLLTNGGGRMATDALLAGGGLLILLNLALSLRKVATHRAQPPGAEEPEPQRPS